MNSVNKYAGAAEFVFIDYFLIADFCSLSPVPCNL
jgi:hypothetical protein